jgi:YfiH family protein
VTLVWKTHARRPHFQFAALSGLPGVVHGVFPRFGWDDGGRRTAVSYGTGNSPGLEQAWENRRVTARVAGVEAAVFARQVHGARVGVWEQGHHFTPGDVQGSAFPDIDALVTDAPGVALGILTADCQSVLMVDPVRRAVANVHSGWRGSMRNIIGHTVAALQSRYGSRPADIVAAIAPSLGPCCAQYVDYRRDFPQMAWRYRGPGDRFDFWRMSVDQLIAAGVPARRISMSGVCTRCNPHLFYSYRGDRTVDRCATIIGLGPSFSESDG